MWLQWNDTMVPRSVLTIMHAGLHWQIRSTNEHESTNGYITHAVLSKAADPSDPRVSIGSLSSPGLIF